MDRVRKFSETDRVIGPEYSNPSEEASEHPNTCHFSDGMTTTDKNTDLVSYYCTKHSWRGKYKRVLSVGTHAISTYNPGSSELTNQWFYIDVFGIVPSTKSTNEFNLIVRKSPGKPTQQTVTFSSDHRLELLTNALKHFTKFTGNQKIELTRFRSIKVHWSDHRVEVYLVITPCSIDQYSLSGKKLTSYNYKDIQSVAKVQDYPGGFVIICGTAGRMHFFATDQIAEFCKCVENNSMKCMAVSINTQKKVLGQADFAQGRLGNFSDDQSLTSFSEFNVYKRSNRHAEPVSRLFCLTESCIVERDPGTYNVCTSKALSDIYALTRHQEDPQMFTVEFISGIFRTYTCADRDALLASVLDGARGNKNKDIHIKSFSTNIGARIGPLYLAVEEVSFHLLYRLKMPIMTPVIGSNNFLF